MRTASPSSRARRAGFSLTEVVVATTLLGIGALGVASTTAFTARLTSSAVASDLATRAVSDVVDSLRGTACASLASGGRTSPVGVLSWRVTRWPSVARLDVVLMPSSRRVGAARIAETLVPCE
jgi:prepilin-type N-terminal cleavage/methylation domain-containing protein